MEDLTQPHADTEVPNETTRTNEAPLAPAHGSALPFGFRHLRCTNCHTTLAALDTLELGNMRWCDTCQCMTEWTYAPNNPAQTPKWQSPGGCL
jgi:hypothetical protein